MRSLQLSSGDLIADRRAAYAAGLAEQGDHGAAAELMVQALDLAPGWTAGWQLLGDYRSEAGDIAGAAEAYRHVKDLDADGIFGATLTLAAHGAGAMPVGTDTGYVASLFDDYAQRFDRELLDDLGYAVPQRLGRIVAEALAGRRIARAVDLGCGTGLMGAEVRPFCERLEGVDLSAGMLEEARRKGIYDRLERAELVAFLGADAGGIALLTAADVLNYVGGLPPVLSAARAALAPGGLLCFSLELHDGIGTLLQRRQLRYAHNADEALAECRGAGLEIVSAERMALRRERDVPVSGLLVLARKPV